MEPVGFLPRPVFTVHLQLISLRNWFEPDLIRGFVMSTPSTTPSHANTPQSQPSLRDQLLWIGKKLLPVGLFLVGAVAWHALTLDTQNRRFLLKVDKHRLEDAK